MRVLTYSPLIFALAVTAIQDALLEDNAIILARQAPGTPQFQCHYDCGNAVAGGRNPTHCDNTTWIDLYEACLSCALSFDIWKLYGTGVGNAASACSLTASPLSSGGASRTTGESAVPTTGTSSAAPTESTSTGPSTTPAPITGTEAPAPAETTSTISTSGCLSRSAFEPILSLVILATIIFGL
ncbi:hypothetical protein QBC43DRAFT_310547 [Cladorrhinum sp. PSN259]|nr:hypothetical protein QBC43DRAFT_310547 [Cladorrhinum sp. PSN259]